MKKISVDEDLQALMIRNQENEPLVQQAGQALTTPQGSESQIV